ncbi:Ankyrin [Mycena sanguinolenta]|uniref:Ankyrin n=1 Tax=Mycena sanguinolenta TaxID=230812 RepID=A0A8H7CHE3_9AGAR|nr:Ankyrin [Mycena sanguinolenta]
MLAELPPELILQIISFLTRLPSNYHLAVGILEKQELIPDLSSINALSQTNTFFYRMLNEILYKFCASVEPLGAAALIFAAQNELESTLDKCVAAGISLDSESISRHPLDPLSIAATMGSRAITAKLLEMYGEGMPVRVHARLPSKTALDLATRNGHMDVVRLLAPIPMPSSDVCPEMTSSPSVQLETQGQYLGRALMQAIDIGHLEISRFLVNQGADINFCQDIGPLMVKAALSRNFELVRFLLASGADPDGLQVSLFNAAKDGRIELVDTLLAAGTDPHARDNASRNVLAVIRDVKLMRLFLELGVDPNHRDSFGSTPLHYICFWPRDETANPWVELLLEFGAAVEAVDHSGPTPVDIAMQDGRPKIVEMLEPLVHDPELKQRIATWKEREGRTRQGKQLKISMSTFLT